MARRPILCQGGDFAFPAGCPTRPCPADDLWVMISGTGGVAAPSPKWSRSLLAQTGWSFQMRCFETHSPHAFRGLTTPSAPTLVAFGIIFLMARPPLLCKEGNTFLFKICPTPSPYFFAISAGMGYIAVRGRSLWIGRDRR